MVKEVPAAINPDTAIKQLRGRVALWLPLLGNSTHGGVVTADEMGKGKKRWRRYTSRLQTRDAVGNWFRCCVLLLLLSRMI